MYKKFLFSLIIVDFVVCAFFFSLKGFLSTQLALFSTFILPFLSLKILQSKLAKFAPCEEKSKIFLRNFYDYELEILAAKQNSQDFEPKEEQKIGFFERYKMLKKSKKSRGSILKNLKFASVFLNFYKFGAYLFFCLAILLLLRHNLFSVGAFFAASFAGLFCLIFLRAKND